MLHDVFYLYPNLEGTLLKGAVTCFSQQDYVIEVNPEKGGGRDLDVRSQRETTIGEVLDHCIESDAASVQEGNLGRVFSRVA